MQSFRITVDREHKEEVFARRKTAGARFEKMLDDVETEVSDLQNEIRALLDHETMSDARKPDSIRAILDRDRESVVDVLRTDIRKSAAAEVPVGDHVSPLPAPAKLYFPGGLLN